MGQHSVQHYWQHSVPLLGVGTEETEMQCLSLLPARTRSLFVGCVQIGSSSSMLQSMQTYRLNCEFWRQTDETLTCASPLLAQWQDLVTRQSTTSAAVLLISTLSLVIPWYCFLLLGLEPDKKHRYFRAGCSMQSEEYRRCHVVQWLSLGNRKLAQIVPKAQMAIRFSLVNMHCSQNVHFSSRFNRL